MAKPVTRAISVPDTAFLTAFIDAVNKADTDNFRRHCQEVHGERWKREFEERKAKGQW